jgi:hypothetical protein
MRWKLPLRSCQHNRFQNDANVLMFRYDDTPHFPALSTFPHHKHMRKTVIAHNKPDLLNVLQEAAEWA